MKSLCASFEWNIITQESERKIQNELSFQKIDRMSFSFTARQLSIGVCTNFQILSWKFWLFPYERRNVKKFLLSQMALFWIEVESKKAIFETKTCKLSDFESNSA